MSRPNDSSDFSNPQDWLAYLDGFTTGLLHNHRDLEQSHATLKQRVLENELDISATKDGLDLQINLTKTLLERLDVLDSELKSALPRLDDLAGVPESKKPFTPEGPLMPEPDEDKGGSWFVSTVRETHPRPGQPIRSMADVFGFEVRTVGHYPSMDGPTDIVKEDLGDLNEAGYWPWLVAEWIPHGIYPMNEEPRWFWAHYEHDEGWVWEPATGEEPAELRELRTKKQLVAQYAEVG